MQISSPLLFMVISGIFLGAWPIVMTKSGLTGAASGAVGAGISALILVPIVLLSGQLMQNVSWWYAVASGLCCAAGLWFFFHGLNIAGEHTVGKMFTLMIVVQITVPIVYQLFLSKGIPDLKTGIGLAAALVVAVMLS